MREGNSSSPKQQRETESRMISDADLIKQGGKIDEHGQLIATEEAIRHAAARHEMQERIPTALVEKFFGVSKKDLDAFKTTDKEQARGESRWNTWKFRSSLEGKLQEIDKATEGRIPDELADHFVRLAETAASRKLDWDRIRMHADSVISFSQLGVLSGFPAFMKHPKYVDFINAMKGMDALPVGFNMYVDYYGKAFGKETLPPHATQRERKQYEAGSGTYVLKDGIGPDHIANFTRLAEDPKLWNDGSSEFRRQYFSAVAEALEHMPDGQEDATREARLALLKRNAERENHAEIRFHTVYSFESPADKQALETLIQEEPASPAAKEARKILSGDYENTMWAI